jgi:hypothetical protein
MSLFDDLNEILQRRWGKPTSVGQRDSEWSRPIGTIRLTGDIGLEFPAVWLIVSTPNDHASAQWKVSGRQDLNQAVTKATAFVHSNKDF